MLLDETSYSTLKKLCYRTQSRASISVESEVVWSSPSPSFPLSPLSSNSPSFALPSAPFPFIPFPTPSHFHPSRSLPLSLPFLTSSPPLPLEVGPLNPVRASGRAQMDRDRQPNAIFSLTVTERKIFVKVKIMNPLTQTEMKSPLKQKQNVKKLKRENTKWNEKVSKPLRSLDCRGCTATVSCAT